jgi:hypothetical protein
MDREIAQERHRKLINEGWVRRFTADEPRLSEMKEFYESLGLEVLVEPGVTNENPEECQTCFEASDFEGRYKTLYTRGEETGGPSDTDDLL